MYGAQSLAKNYWRAGKDHYDRGEYEKASEAFANVKKLAPKSVEARNAARLQSNIDLLAGKLLLKERSQKVAGAKVRSKTAADNRRLTEKQQEYLEKSAQAAQEGRYEEATRQYKAAESLRDELVSRGEDAGRQSAVLAKGKSKVAVAEEQLRARSGELRERYETSLAEGKYEAAQKQLGELRKLREDDKEELGREMEELVLLRAKQRAALARVTHGQPQQASQGRDAQPEPDAPVESPSPVLTRGRVARWGGAEERDLPQRDRADVESGGGEDGPVTDDYLPPAPPPPDATAAPESLAGLSDGGAAPRQPRPVVQLPAEDGEGDRDEARAATGDGRLEDASDTFVLDGQQTGRARAVRMAEQGRAKRLPDAPDAAVPWHELLAFPDNWKDLSARRRSSRADERLEGDDYGDSTVSMDGDRRRETTTRVYDVRDLIARVQDVAGPRLDVAEAAAEKGDDEESAAREKLIAGLTRTVTSTMWSARTGTGTIQQRGGQLIITQTAEGHKELQSLLNQLREARGPQVETGANIAQQRAAIQLDTTTESVPDHATVRADGGVFVAGRDVDTHFQLESTVVDDDKKDQSRQFDEFYDRNYGWRDGRRADKISPEKVAERARFNLGQKVGVSSLNVGVTADVARSLNVEFVQGRNNLRYAIVDEAQVRTLRQLANERPAGGTNENPRNQETIVGTDALLSNAMELNVAYARDRGNRLDILDNPVELSQEKYILIDNNGYLTAVKAGAMQHWTDVTVFEPLAEIPQTIDVPRAGQLVKLEKTHVDPADRLEIRATYRFTPGQ